MAHSDEGTYHGNGFFDDGNRRRVGDICLVFRPSNREYDSRPDAVRPGLNGAVRSFHYACVRVERSLCGPGRGLDRVCGLRGFPR